MTDQTLAIVSLTTGDPTKPGEIVTALTWMIGDGRTGEAFRQAMTERYGHPIASMQPGDSVGTDDGLVIFGEPGGGSGG